MVILFTHQLEIKNSNFKDKELLILVSSSNELRKNIIIFADQKIYKDTLLEFNCWFDKEGLDLCYDTLELPLGSSEGILLPELPSCWSGNNYFSFIHFKKDSAYYFEANILKHKIFLDNPQKKKKREELAIRISNCLVEFINKLVI
jgi:hypothetical protein